MALQNRALREGYFPQRLTNDLRTFLSYQLHSLGLTVLKFYDRKCVAASDMLQYRTNGD